MGGELGPYGKFLKVSLKSNEFNKFVYAQGIKVQHCKSALCPSCYDVDSNHYDINCDICDNGRIHFDPREVWVLFYQKKMEEMFQVQGVWELGDVLVTFPAIYEDQSVVRVDYFDRITILDFEERTSDLVTRASGDIDKIRYIVKDVILLKTKTTEYFKDTDFEIVDTNIRWITGANRPTAGEIYTLVYNYPPVYRVVNFFHEQRYYYDSHKQPAGTRIPTYLPIQAQVRRDYIIEDRRGYD